MNLVVKFLDEQDETLPRLKLYGDPEALRALAQVLLQIADHDQSTSFPEEEGSHWHLRPAPRPSHFLALHERSMPLDLGRLDCPKDGSFGWFLGPDEV